jgi:FAD/FMN-containing dehydrogenase
VSELDSVQPCEAYLSGSAHAPTGTLSGFSQILGFNALYDKAESVDRLVTVQAGVTLIQLHKWLGGRGLEVSPPHMRLKPLTPCVVGGGPHGEGS